MIVQAKRAAKPHRSGQAIRRAVGLRGVRLPLVTPPYTSDRVKVFAYEFASGGGFVGQPLTPGLAREGDMMLRALLDDLARVPGIEVLATRDPRLPPLHGVDVHVASPDEDPLALYARCVAAADAAWPTAPETDGMLERLASETLRQEKLLLGCRPEAVRLATSKRGTARALASAGIASVPTFALSDGLPPLDGPWVTKPDEGAGCTDTLLVPDVRAARERLALMPDGMVAQPWLEGTSASLSLLCAAGRAALLSVNLQHGEVSDGWLGVGAISVNARRDDDGTLARLGGRIAAAVPGLWGYVGVDLVLTPAGPVVLEINPRLTTSYCGLRRELDLNVAEQVLALARTGDPVLPASPNARHTVTLELDAHHAA